MYRTGHIQDPPLVTLSKSSHHGMLFSLQASSFSNVPAEIDGTPDIQFVVEDPEFRNRNETIDYYSTVGALVINERQTAMADMAYFNRYMLNLLNAN